MQGFFPVRIPDKTTHDQGGGEHDSLQSIVTVQRLQTRYKRSANHSGQQTHRRPDPGYVSAFQDEHDIRNRIRKNTKTRQKKNNTIRKWVATVTRQNKRSFIQQQKLAMSAIFSFDSKRFRLLQESGGRY